MNTIIDNETFNNPKEIQLKFLKINDEKYKRVKQFMTKQVSDKENKNKMFGIFRWIGLNA